MATVTKGAETAARNPGMVIMRPAIPSETVKLDPIEVSRPIGRISVVTIEKIPSITDITADQETKVERSDGAGERTEVVVSVDMNPVPSWHRMRSAITSPAETGTAIWRIFDTDNGPQGEWHQAVRRGRPPRDGPRRRPGGPRPRGPGGGGKKPPGGGP
ncbi:hypothetical protein, partial [Streptomyces vietnamensis]|uniref:hypothetical protein n=1 Tax=Streptomyces vietnamensis TaxID=362257 RepID=UPI003F4D56C3